MESVWNDLDQSTGNRKQQWGYPVKTLAELSFKRSARCKNQANDKTHECVSKLVLPTLKTVKILANFSNKKALTEELEPFLITEITVNHP